MVNTHNSLKQRMEDIRQAAASAGEKLDLRFASCIPRSAIVRRLEDPSVQATVRSCLDTIGAHPTPEQWTMILAPTEATCVVAGAGSGKSTTLILRVLVFHKILGIPLDDLHIFSFTKESTRDFRRKLAEQLLVWEELIEGIPPTDERREYAQVRSNRAVGTFHSVLNRILFMLTQGHQRKPIFDMLEEPEIDDEDVDHDDLDAPADDAENLLIEGRLSDVQLQLLRATHNRAYHESDEYRLTVDELVAAQEKRRWLRGVEHDIPAEKRKDAWHRFMAQEEIYHGLPVTERLSRVNSQIAPEIEVPSPPELAVSRRLRELGVTYMERTPFTVVCPVAPDVAETLHASFRVGDTFIHVERYGRILPQSDPEHGLSWHESHRRKIIYTRSADNKRHKLLKWGDHLDNYDGEIDLTADGDLLLRSWLAQDLPRSMPRLAPVLSLSLPGNYREQALEELLYREGRFIESMSLLPIDRSMVPQGDHKLDPLTVSVLELLSVFWPIFKSLVTEEHIRFDDAIKAMTKSRGAIFRYRNALAHLKHLFIDEFQDISPDVARWLIITLLAHASAGDDVSVTCIGDDFQSIYSWRGAHPGHILHFPKHFPAWHPPSHIVLGDNFRSRQTIIDAGEAVVNTVGEKIPKHGRSRLDIEERAGVSPILLVDEPQPWRAEPDAPTIWTLFSEHIVNVLHDLDTQNKSQHIFGERRSLSVFILSRSRAGRRMTPRISVLQNTLLGHLRASGQTRFEAVQVKRMTMHSSKGLEADFVLMTGDTVPASDHPLRDYVYATLKMQRSYSEVQSDEARRLAYVSMTRARLGLVWAPLVAFSEKDLDDMWDTQSEGSYAILRAWLQKETLGQVEGDTLVAHTGVNQLHHFADM